ncbi:uncharacterized protein LOC111786748 [Cucurbita pepo subsp. pepo]|uniref:uncharacterized protein LOC111778234 n=1 Tax=Cucurbita pepo subsp. pepo TaxID=3664 RepID=UPI000C9D3A2C|nr:uncharacterized protein LOC111778234 [Cucurbita pepo subsp. pepo]XP_023522745.1 uncharacterized protein LOC111786748 [Cucurbita pepo subsp. pepo]
MEKEQRLELIKLAIERLLDENKNKQSSDRSYIHDCDENGDRTLLHDLLSQIESLKERTKEGTESEKLASALDNLKSKAKNSDDDEFSREDIVKELKKVKRQNVLTQCLVSVMIVVTVVWQLSEVSIMLNVKDQISHPFRFLGSLISGALKRPKTIVENSSKQEHDEASMLPPLQIPELHHMGLQ